MHKQTVFAALCQFLAERYPASSLIATILNDAGLDGALVANEGTIVRQWATILEALDADDRVDTLLNVIHIDHGADPAFLSVYHQYRWWRTASAPPTTSPQHGVATVTLPDRLPGAITRAIHASARTAPQTRVLFIDNDQQTLHEWQQILAHFPYDVLAHYVQSPQWLAECLATINHFRPHVIVVDMRLEDDRRPSDRSALELLQALQRFCPAFQPIVYSAYLDVRLARYVQDLGGTFLPKDENPHELVALIHAIARSSSAEAAKEDAPIYWPPQWNKSTLLANLLPDLEHTVAKKFLALLDDLILQTYPACELIQIYPPELTLSAPPMLARHDPAVTVAIAVNGRTVKDIVRFTKSEFITNEVEQYKRYIAPDMAPLLSVQCKRSQTFWDIGAVVYSLVGQDERPMPSFWTFYQRQSDADASLALLQPFFQTWRFFYERRSHIRGSIFDLFTDLAADDHLATLTQTLAAEQLPAMRLPAPFGAWVAELAYLHRRDYRTAVVHGNFCCENLLTNGEQLWPINFERTGPGPIFRDFCDLEVDLLLHTVAEVADPHAIDKLMRGLLNLHLDTALPATLPMPCAKLFTFVQLLRDMAHTVTNVANTLDYYGTLLLATLQLLLHDQPPIPLSTRRLAYRYAALLCQRCRTLEIPLLDATPSPTPQPTASTPVNGTGTAPLHGNPNLLADRDKARLFQLLNTHPAWANRAPHQRKEFLQFIGIPPALVGNLAFDGTDLDTMQLLNRLPIDQHAPDKPTHTLAGLLVAGLLNHSATAEGKDFLVQMLAHYRLIKDEKTLTTHGIFYAQPAHLHWDATTPRFPWHGPTDQPALERIWSQRAKFHDVVFLERGIQVARATGRVEDSLGNALGTGFLVAPDLLLTNHHVLPANTDLHYRQLRFGYRIDERGLLQSGEIYQLKEIVAHSADNELDFALVRLQDAPGDNAEIGYLPLIDTHIPVDGALYIIQHPAGEPQKIVLQDNWTTYVAPDHRRVQYLTNTKGGSSGAPVCNELWQVVALHHSGTPIPALPESVDIRGNEGIPIKAILPLIRDFLPTVE